MIDYFLNWMGPINQKWIENNGTDWSSGRIDVDGIENEPFGTEYPIPPMKSEDWNYFSDWLSELETVDVWDLKRLIAEYELSNKKIRWLQNEK